MNPASVLVLAGLAATAGLIALVAIRGRRVWLQATFAACGVAFFIPGVAFVGTTEGLLPAVRDDVILGTMLAAYALNAVLVLGLIHGETLPRKRAATFLILAPVPLIAVYASSEGWTLASAYDGNPVGGFLVLCLGVALAETIYARATSRLLGAQTFWLSLGVIALIVAGPLYTYELQILNQPTFGAANLASPLALGCFAFVALRGDPFPTSPQPPRRRTRPAGLRMADAVVFDEERPKYASVVGHSEASSGRATLVLGRGSPRIRVAGASFASIAGRHAAVRTLATAADFLGTAPGGLVVLEGLADLSALSGWAPSVEALVRMRHLARGAGGTLLVCPDRLTQEERQSIRALRWTWWTLPDPAREIQAILAGSFGTGAPRLFQAFCRSHGVRPEDVTTDHVQALLGFLQRALSELSGAVEGTAAHGLRVQFEAMASVLRTFAAQGPEEVARGKWPSRKASETGTELLVTASEYWKGREMEELFTTAEDLVDREPLFERARSLFVEQFGDAGENVLRAQLDRLGKKPEDLGPADLARIADRASVDLGSLAEVVDLPQERARIRKQIESIRERLEVLAEEHR